MSKNKSVKVTPNLIRNSTRRDEKPRLSFKDEIKVVGEWSISNSVRINAIIEHLVTKGRALRVKNSININSASLDAAESASFLLVRPRMKSFLYNYINGRIVHKNNVESMNMNSITYTIDISLNANFKLSNRTI